MFTYNEWGANPQYEEMAKAAVKSGMQVGNLKPFCLFHGNQTSSMYRWLVTQGVTVVQVHLGCCRPP